MNLFVDGRPGARGASSAGATRRSNRAAAGPLQLLLGSRLHGRAALAPLVARLGAGAVFVIFSIGKFARHGPEAESFERYGIPFPDALTYVVGLLELGGGLLLILGLLTRLAALGLAVNLVVAIATAGRIEGGPIHLGLAPVLLATMLFLIWAGPGAASLDERLLGRAPASPGLPAHDSG